MTLKQGGDGMESEAQPDAPAEPEQPAAETAAPAEGGGKQADEYLAALQRLKADFDNYRRRVGQEQARWGDTAVAGFIVQLLPVVDNLERAMGAAGDGDAVRQGVELTVRQLRDVLSAAGVTPMETVGLPFDPARHEAVARGAAPGLDEGLIAEEYRRGYVFRDQVLRPAMVKVSSGETPAEDIASRSREAADGDAGGRKPGAGGRGAPESERGARREPADAPKEGDR